MNTNTKDKAGAAIGGACTAIIACVVAVVFVFASGDSASARGVNADLGHNAGAVAGVLLSPRTRLIIDYQRTALA